MMGDILSCVNHLFWLLLIAVISMCTWNLIRRASACWYMLMFWHYFSKHAIFSLPFTEGSDREGSGGDTTWTPASSKSSLCTQLNLPAMQRAAAPFWCLVWWDQKEADAAAEDLGSSYSPSAGKAWRYGAPWSRWLASLQLVASTICSFASVTFVKQVFLQSLESALTQLVKLANRCCE